MMVAELRFFTATTLFFCLCPMLFFFVPALSAEETALSLSGQYRNLLILSETASGSSYYLDSNRIRIEASGQPAEMLSYTLKYDNNLSITTSYHFLPR